MAREQASWWRRLKQGRAIPLDDSVDLPTEDPSGYSDLRLAMRYALRRLPPHQRAVLVLRYYEDLSETQTAATLGCSIATVRSRTHRAIVRLRQVPPERDITEVPS